MKREAGGGRSKVMAGEPYRQPWPTDELQERWARALAHYLVAKGRLYITADLLRATMRRSAELLEGMSQGGRPF